MPTNTPGTDARTVPYQQVAYLRYRLTAATPNALNGVRIGNLPAGAIVTDIVARCGTAFNGTTPGVTVGTNATAYNNFAVGTDIAVTANTSSRVTTGMGLIMTADSPVFAKLAGTSVTAGDVVITVMFIVNNDQ